MLLFVLQYTGRQEVITSKAHLGVAQLVARYLGVVEAASSSLVTQTKTRVHNEPSFFFYFLANPRKISRFLDK